ncbi:MAG: hypothetical protein WB662_09940 [Methyloceanibacter sp.]
MPAPSLIAFKQGVGISRKRGTYVLVGLPLGEFPVPRFDVVANSITIRGLLVGTRGDWSKRSRSHRKPISSRSLCRL